MIPFPKRRFKIILADPPWAYNSRANHKTRFRGGASGHYNLMTMKDIRALPVEKIAAPDAVLFMWCTFPYLKEQLEVFEAWGFKYKTVAFTWVKTNPKNGKPFFGVGYYAKSNAEVCMLGTRGKVMKPISNCVSSVIISPRREHSRKPDEARDRIVELYGKIPRIELFAREKIRGWNSWGDQL